MNSPEYLAHQAREFHSQAADSLIQHQYDSALANLVIAVDYLIEYVTREQPHDRSKREALADKRSRP